MTPPPPPSSSSKSSGEEPIVIPTVHTVTVTESEELGWELEGVVQATGSVAGVTAMAENVGEYGELLDEYGNKVDSADTSVAAARDPGVFGHTGCCAWGSWGGSTAETQSSALRHGCCHRDTERCRCHR